MAIARALRTCIDCPDPAALADFYAALLGGEPDVEDDGSWASLDPARLDFQRVDDYRAPQWPGQESPQQLHLDIDVDDLDAGEQEVLARGATKADHQPGTTFRVFLDPAGHPFCLCVGWKQDAEAGS